MDVKLVYIYLLITTASYYTCGSLEFEARPEEASANDFISYDKRAGMRPYPFPCNGYDNMPRCLHGGKGPRKTWTKSGRFCVCLCPAKWAGAECAFAAGTGMGKRAFDYLDSQALIQDEEDKRNYGPWEIMERDDDKRNYGPWQVIQKHEKRDYGPWQAMLTSDVSKRDGQFLIEKRPYPWLVWDSTKSGSAQNKRIHPWNPTAQRGLMQSSINWKYPTDRILGKRSGSETLRTRDHGTDQQAPGMRNNR